MVLGVVQNDILLHSDIKLEYIPLMQNPDRRQTTACSIRDLATSSFGNDSRSFELNTSPTTIKKNAHGIYLNDPDRTVGRCNMPGTVYLDLFDQRDKTLQTRRETPRAGIRRHAFRYQNGDGKITRGLGSSFWGPPVSSMVFRRGAILHNS